MKKLSIVLGLAISVLTANAALAAVRPPPVCHRKLAAMMLRGDNKGNAYTQQMAQNKSNSVPSSNNADGQM